MTQVCDHLITYLTPKMSTAASVATNHNPTRAGASRVVGYIEHWWVTGKDEISFRDNISF